MKTTIYYSVKNCGDGSAYPSFFYDKECADHHQEHQEEGWGEHCVGSLTITHTGDIKIDNCQTYEEYLSELENDLQIYKGDEDWAKSERQKIHISISDLKKRFK